MLCCSVVLLFISIELEVRMALFSHCSILLQCSLSSLTTWSFVHVVSLLNPYCFISQSESDGFLLRLLMVPSCIILMFKIALCLWYLCLLKLHSFDQLCLSSLLILIQLHSVHLCFCLCLLLHAISYLTPEHNWGFCLNFFEYLGSHFFLFLNLSIKLITFWVPLLNFWPRVLNNTLLSSMGSC